MKKAIIYSILVSIILIAGAYYYFFIMESVEEIPKLPSKVKVVMPKISSINLAKDNINKPGEKQEVKKEEPKRVEEAKTIPQKEVPTTKEKSKQVEAVKEKTGEVAIKQEQQKKEISKKPRYYKIEAVYSDEELANSVRDSLISLGYHTAKLSKVKNSYYVILSPFTDYYEAEFVRKNVEMETKKSEFKTKAVY